MSNLITIEDEKAVVSIDTIVRFSGNTENHIKKMIRDNFDTLIEFGLSYDSGCDFTDDTTLIYSEMKFNEQSATFLLTMMRNTPVVIEFKKNLIREFFSLRERYQFDMNNDFDKQIKQLQEAKKLCNIYDNRYTSCRGLVQHTDTELTETQIKENLHTKDYIRPIYKRVKTWEITKRGEASGLFDLDNCSIILYDMNKVTDVLKIVELPANVHQSRMEIHVYNGFTGEFHCTFGSLKSAERELGVSGISGILNGSRGNGKQHIRGMCFRTGDTAPESIEPLTNTSKIFRDINVFKNGAFIEKCNTMKLAGSIGSNGVTQVGRLLKNGKANQYGFTYSYAELEFNKREVG